MKSGDKLMPKVKGMKAVKSAMPSGVSMKAVKAAGVSAVRSPASVSPAGVSPVPVLSEVEVVRKLAGWPVLAYRFYDDGVLIVVKRDGRKVKFSAAQVLEVRG